MPLRWLRKRRYIHYPKVLADENISKKVINALTNKGIDIVPIKELTSGVSDEIVLETANRQNRILITFDSDFGELIFRQKLKARGVILLKFAPKSTQQIIDTTLNVLKTQTIEGHFVIVKEKKIRVLRLK